MSSTCSKCSALLPDGQPFCTSCGTRRNELQAEESGPRFCTGCGSLLAAGLSFCTKCGTRSPQPSTPTDTSAPPLPPVRLPVASNTGNVAPSEPPVRKSSSLGFKLFMMAAAVMVLGALALGAGLVYLGYRAKKKVEAVKQAYKNDDLAGVVGAVTGKTSTPQPLPNWKLASAELVSSSASKVPLRVSLRLVESGSDPLRGDYESIYTVDSVTEKEVHIQGSQEFPTGDALDPLLGRSSSKTEEAKKIACGRTVYVADIQNSAEMDGYFCRERNDERHPGTTAMGLSKTTFNELKSSGQSEFTLHEDPLQSVLKSFKTAMSADSDASRDAASKALMDKMMNFAPGANSNVIDTPALKCTLEREGPTDLAFPVLVNDHPAELPVINVALKLSGNSDAPHIYILDDPDNPLVMAVASTRGHGQIIKIYWSKPEAPKGEASQLEKDLEKDGRAKVYDLYFDFRKDALKPESKKVLDEIAQAMRDHPDWKLSIEGHTDSIGGDAFNLDLSKRRAEAVKQALASEYQVVPERFSTAGYGAAGPIATNDTLEGRALNRRVELARQ